MTTLIFNDSGWTVTTSAYTIATSGQRTTAEIHYLWSWTSYSVSMLRLPFSTERFNELLRACDGPILDLRPHQ